MGIAEQIHQQVQALAEGKLFTAAQLLGLGTRAATDQSLARLARSGQITRLARGIYLLPTHASAGQNHFRKSRNDDGLHVFRSF